MGGYNSVGGGFNVLSFYVFPVDNLPDAFKEVGSNVLVVPPVGMFPNIDSFKAIYKSRVN